MRPGTKPKGKVLIKWSPDFAYAIGLIVADGCLYKDGRHLSLTSTDKEQIETFKKCLNLSNKTGIKLSGGGNPAYHVQFGDVLFYQFLVGIGITPAKSNTIGPVSIPEKYFLDFLRGYFDGDGSSYSHYDIIYKNSFRFYISFTSGSRKYLDWLRAKLFQILGVRGYISLNRNNSYTQLKYSKKEAVVISEKMYYSKELPRLKRKYLKIKTSLHIIESSRSGEIGRRAAFRSQ
ncbi:MAG: Intein-containing protein [Parcubacteria group bacterium GW2011_GWA2_47_16]|nr:MAG: Intein-containing protein [Parcubacteria group bacterium GW2011_GWA2_47_16]